MDQLNLTTAEMAEIAVNGEAFEKKTKNTLEHLRTRFDQIKPKSDKSREFAGILGKILGDLEDNVSPKLVGLSGVVSDLKAKIEKLEDSDEILAGARNAFKESSRQGKVKLER